MVRQNFCAKGTKSLLGITKTYMTILNIKEFRLKTLNYQKFLYRLHRYRYIKRHDFYRINWCKNRIIGQIFNKCLMLLGKKIAYQLRDGKKPSVLIKNPSPLIQIRKHLVHYYSIHSKAIVIYVFSALTIIHQRLCVFVFVLVILVYKYPQQ